jgi:hypothetical protein
MSSIVEFVVEKVTLGQDFFQVPRLPLAILIPPNAPKSSRAHTAGPLMDSVSCHHTNRKNLITFNTEYTYQTTNLEFFLEHTSQSQL